MLKKSCWDLRRIKGVCWKEISINLTEQQKDELTIKIDMLKQKKLIAEVDGLLQLTPAGLIVENEIITRLSL